MTTSTPGPPSPVSGPVTGVALEDPSVVLSQLSGLLVAPLPVPAWGDERRVHATERCPWSSFTSPERGSAWECAPRACDCLLTALSHADATYLRACAALQRALVGRRAAVELLGALARSARPLRPHELPVLADGVRPLAVPLGLSHHAEAVPLLADHDAALSGRTRDALHVPVVRRSLSSLVRTPFTATSPATRALVELRDLGDHALLAAHAHLVARRGTLALVSAPTRVLSLLASTPDRYAELPTSELPRALDLLEAASRRS